MKPEDLVPIRSDAELRRGLMIYVSEGKPGMAYVGTGRGWHLLIEASPTWPCGHRNWRVSGPERTLHGCVLAMRIREGKVFRLQDLPPEQEETEQRPVRRPERVG